MGQRAARAINDALVISRAMWDGACNSFPQGCSLPAAFERAAFKACNALLVYAAIDCMRHYQF